MNNVQFTNELLHYGKPKRSGRYPYGSGERPFQSLGLAIGKAKQTAGKLMKKKNQLAKQRADNEAEKRAEAKRKHDAEKPDVLQRGSATKVMQYKGELTNKELQDVVTRLRLEGTLKEMAGKENKGNMQKIDDAMQQLKKIDDWAKIGSSAYNTFVGVYNSTAEGKKKPLTKIS